MSEQETYTSPNYLCTTFVSMLTGVPGRVLESSAYYNDSHPFMLSTQLPIFAYNISHEVEQYHFSTVLDTDTIHGMGKGLLLLEVIASLPDSEALSATFSALYRSGCAKRFYGATNVEISPVQKLTADLNGLEMTLDRAMLAVREMENGLFDVYNCDEASKKRVAKLRRDGERLLGGFNIPKERLLERMPKDSVGAEESSAALKHSDRFMGFAEGTWEKEGQEELRDNSQAEEHRKRLRAEAGNRITATKRRSYRQEPGSKLDEIVLENGTQELQEASKQQTKASAIKDLEI